MKTRIKKLSLGIALAMSVAANAYAAPVLFDPDGAGATGAQYITGIDWLYSSFLAQNGNQAFNNFIGTQGACPTTASCDFNVFTHSSMIGATNGTSTVTFAGLNTQYEITMIAGFKETVTSAGASAVSNFATFATTPGQTGFLQIFFDSTKDANPLTGYGYNDGRLILDATLVADSSGFFTAFVNQPPVNLDQQGSNDYTGQLTINGTGSQQPLPVGGITQDTAFFKSLLEDFGIKFENISIGLPYGSIDPSECFNTSTRVVAVGGSVGNIGDNTHVNGKYSANACSGGLYLPNVGDINGLGRGSPDFVAQTDYNSNFSAKVPEPATVGLLGLALLGLGATRRRKA